MCHRRRNRVKSKQGGAENEAHEKKKECERSWRDSEQGERKSGGTHITALGT